MQQKAMNRQRVMVWKRGGVMSYVRKGLARCDGVEKTGSVHKKGQSGVGKVLWRGKPEWQLIM